MDSQAALLITILLAANTSILGVASALLFKRLDNQDKALARERERIDTHTQDHGIHTVSIPGT